MNKEERIGDRRKVSTSSQVTATVTEIKPSLDKVQKKLSPSVINADTTRLTSQLTAISPKSDTGSSLLNYTTHTLTAPLCTDYLKQRRSCSILNQVIVDDEHLILAVKPDEKIPCKVLLDDANDGANYRKGAPTKFVGGDPMTKHSREIRHLTENAIIKAENTKEGQVEPSELATVDFLVSTIGLFKDLPLITTNMVLSILTVDYPKNLVSCYVSHDGAVTLSLESLVIITESVRKWVTFCIRISIEPSAPDFYFSQKID
ncbi:unnamed protein product [Lactuca saligna]|uniref:Uncharacterized protein n=1 Tax=Lactuca saligna TaxID=75948 RepID=A0AA36EIB3_LACSI|nr:unnamed protein product [Lactuca saligna]